MFWTKIGRKLLFQQKHKLKKYLFENKKFPKKIANVYKYILQYFNIFNLKINKNQELNDTKLLKVGIF